MDINRGTVTWAHSIRFDVMHGIFSPVNKIHAAEVE